MKKYLSRLVIGILGFASVLVIFNIWRQLEVVKKQSVTASPMIYFAQTPMMKRFEWRQPLLHPTFPPKLVKGETEFVLR